MKKVLGWAIVAICLSMLFYYGADYLGGAPSNDVSNALFAAAIAVIVTFFPSRYTYGPVLIFLGVVLVAGEFRVLAVILATILMAFGAYKVAEELGIEFKWVFTVYLIEGAGIYTTLKLGLWQPAAVVAFILGIWWLAVWLAEKKKLRLASV